MFPQTCMYINWTMKLYANTIIFLKINYAHINLYLKYLVIKMMCEICEIVKTIVFYWRFVIFTVEMCDILMTIMIIFYWRLVICKVGKYLNILRSEYQVPL